jgi:SAM-dependent MidA family methyltransferase
MVSTTLQLPTIDELDAARIAVSDALRERLLATIAQAPNQQIDFAVFMESALYDEHYGYYMHERSKIGERGDFVTAPELSSAFSQALASPVVQVLEQVGSGCVMEIGAGNGVMARDVLAELAARDCLPLCYYILERSLSLRARQRSTVAALPESVASLVCWVDEPPEMSGVILANEVLDALSVRRFVMRDGKPLPLMVGASDGAFIWCEGAADAQLSQWFESIAPSLPAALPDGYRSEWCAQLPGALARFCSGLRQGVALFADYGYPCIEFYHPQRVDGTLLCHFEHRAHSDPLVLVGLQDLTASVDFTAVADSATQANMEVIGFTAQTWFLMGCGLEALAARASAGGAGATPDSVAAAADLRRLLLPGEMGERIKMIGLARDFDLPLDAFALRDQRERL